MGLRRYLEYFRADLVFSPVWEGEYLLGRVDVPSQHCFCCSPFCVALLQFLNKDVVKLDMYMLESDSRFP